MDIRGVDEEAVRGVVRDIVAFAERIAKERRQTARYTQRQTIPATAMDDRIVAALNAAAEETGEPFRLMTSGAAHDTMCVSEHVASALVFVPCKDGISHAPDEEADSADAALAAEVILNAIRTLESTAQ